MGKKLTKLGFGLYLLGSVLTVAMVLANRFLTPELLTGLGRIPSYIAYAGLGVAALGFLFRFLGKRDLLDLLAFVFTGIALAVGMIYVVSSDIAPTFVKIGSSAFYVVLALKAAKRKNPILGLLLIFAFAYNFVLANAFLNGGASVKIIVRYLGNIIGAMLCHAEVKGEK